MIRVRYIDVAPWKGARHWRLRRIWTAIEQWVGSAASIKKFMNRGKLSHADCLEQIWHEEVLRPPYGPEQDSPIFGFLLLTEMDFLPDLLDWLTLPLKELGIHECLAPVKQRDNAGDSEVWFTLFNLYRLGGQKIRWHHPRDPGADLHEQIDVKHYKGRLGEGGEDDHLGWEYPWGVHLLGSRHLHDPVDTPLWHGIMAGEFQENHDRAVTRWIAAQPASFRKILGALP
jgi:hypothetical protein